jgi:hypothetical protein
MTTKTVAHLNHLLPLLVGNVDRIRRHSAQMMIQTIQTVAVLAAQSVKRSITVQPNEPNYHSFASLVPCTAMELNPFLKISHVT